MADPNSDYTRLSRAFGRGGVREIVIAAAKAGIRYRFTRKGVMFYGGDGQTITIHFSESDNRAEKNTIARFRKIGFEPTKGKHHG